MSDPIVEELKIQTRVMEKMLHKLDKIEILLNETRQNSKGKDTFLADYFEKMAFGSVILNINKIVQLLENKTKK